MTVRILQGDCRDVLKTLPDESVHCVVTSPPYFGLRDYGHEGQIGLEDTPQEFVALLVAVFEEVRRVLRSDGTAWVNMGDSYNNADKWGGGGANTGKHSKDANGKVPSWEGVRRKWRGMEGCKPKDLLGVPWMLAFALRDSGWWLRQDIIWSKPNPMPESVQDRCTKAHEYLFLLSKSERYYFEADAIAEEVSDTSMARWSQSTIDEQRGSDRASAMCVTCTPGMSGQLTLFVAASPAKTSASPAAGQDSLATAPASGPNTAGSSKNAARRGWSSKTSAPFALADWTRCSGKSLRSGMTRSGTVFPLPPLALPTGGIGSGSWPTPSASHQDIGPEGLETWLARRARVKARGINGNGMGTPLSIAVQMWPTPAARDYRSESCSPEFAAKRNGEARGKTLPWAVRFPTPTANRWDGLQSHGVNVISGSLNPTWVEWLMGFPLGWTALEPSETPSSRRSRKSSAAPSSNLKHADD